MPTLLPWPSSADAVTGHGYDPRDIKTFRGRSLEELLPQIRAELGADAIVAPPPRGSRGRRRRLLPALVRRGRRARRAARRAARSRSRNDRATAEGLASPAIQALVEQAAPFADALARARRRRRPSARREVLVAPPPRPAAADAGLYGPQPNRVAIEEPRRWPTPVDARRPSRSRAGAVIDPPTSPTPRRRRAAAPATRQRPGAPRRRRRRRRAAARRRRPEPRAGRRDRRRGRRPRPAVRRRARSRSSSAPRSPAASPSMADLGGERPPRSPSSAPAAPARAPPIARLAARLRRAPTPTSSSSPCARPTAAAASPPARAARRHRDRRRPTPSRPRAGCAGREAALTLVDTPAAGPADAPRSPQLAADLRALGVDEVHLALPATISAAAADELASALAPLGITHVALTHADADRPPGRRRSSWR